MVYEQPVGIMHVGIIPNQITVAGQFCFVVSLFRQTYGLGRYRIDPGIAKLDQSPQCIKGNLLTPEKINTHCFRKKKKFLFIDTQDNIVFTKWITL